MGWLESASDASRLASIARQGCIARNELDLLASTYKFKKLEDHCKEKKRYWIENLNKHLRSITKSECQGVAEIPGHSLHGISFQCDQKLEMEKHGADLVKLLPAAWGDWGPDGHFIVIFHISFLYLHSQGTYRCDLVTEFEIQNYEDQSVGFLSLTQSTSCKL